MTKENKNQKTTHFKSKEPKKQFKYKFIKRKKGIKAKSKIIILINPNLMKAMK